MKLFTTSNAAFASSLFIFVFLLFCFVVFAPMVSAQIGTFYAPPSGYSFATTCSTDGSSCDNMQEQDDKYNSWINTYNKQASFTLEGFDIPDNALVQNISIILRLRDSVKNTVWKPQISIDGGLNYFDKTCNNCLFYADTSFNDISTGDTMTVPFYIFDPNPLTGKDIKSGKFYLRIINKYPYLSNVDIDKVAFSIQYYINNPTPTPTPTPAKTPFILIPGIGGSEFKTVDMKVWADDNGHGGTFNYLYPQGETVWLNEEKATDFGWDDYFDVLRMKIDGITSEANLETTGNLVARAYQGAIDFFTSNGYELNKDLFVFPYDWRKDIVLTVPLLDQKIKEIKLQTGATKVDIVAHSMGGLVARNYISDLTRAQNVRKLFTLGTPHLGAVDSLKTIRYGNCLTIRELKDFPICIGLNPIEVKDVVQNMISGYELAPSQSYFNFYSEEDNNHPYPYKTESGILNYNQIKSFLTNLSHNTVLFNPSESFHVLDNSLTNTNGVDVTVIAGSGQKTLGQIIEEKRFSLLGIPYIHKDMVNINGDGTVPLLSASLNDPSRNLSLLGNAKVFYTKQEHGQLVASGPALNLVKNILNNDSQLPIGVSVQPYHFSGTRVSVHSPVNMHVYDSLGNHTGPTNNGDFEANIPGSSYDALDDAKFIFLPDNGIYSIKLEATGQGSFDFKIRKFENDINTAAVLYNNVPLSINTKAGTILDTLSTQPPTLRVDQDGNGTIDKNIDPTFVLSGDVVYDDIPPEANIHFDTQTQEVVVTGSDNLGEASIVQTQISKSKEQNIITDKAGNTLFLEDTNRLHGPNAVFSISSLTYNSIATILDTNKLAIRYQTDKNGAIKSFDQTFEIKGIVKIQLSYDPKMNKTTVTIDRQKIIVDGMKILQVTTEKGVLRYSY